MQSGQALIIFATTKKTARISTISAEQGTSITVERKRPPREATAENTADAMAIGVNLCQKTSAVIIGSDIIDISSMMPTRRMVSTIHTATSTVMA